MERDQLQSEVFNIREENLQQTLQVLFDRGETEIEIQHPVEGAVVITREDFEQHKKRQQKLANASPAEKIELRKRHLRQAAVMRHKLVTAMRNARQVTVDPRSEDGMNDIDGNPIGDIAGMTFVPVHQYLPGIVPVDNELGAFVDEYMHRPPIRVVGVVSIEGMLAEAASNES